MTYKQDDDSERRVSYALVAQGIEHLPSKQSVTGSNPVGRTNFELNSDKTD